jgi:hypothetical protein
MTVSRRLFALQNFAHKAEKYALHSCAAVFTCAKISPDTKSGAAGMEAFAGARS